MKTLEDVKKNIRDVVDFPRKGIVFKDLTTVFKDHELTNVVVNDIYESYKDKGITKVLGIESRGFILGSILSNKLEAGFVPVRKKGKLPADVYSEEYALEYGTDTIEIHKDALQHDDVILIHDDLLATGGTIGAVLRILQNFEVKKIYVNFVVELDFLKGREIIKEYTDEVYSVINF
ncbi:MAG: adenine phosphoribosyltransferase [Bacteroidales bacterium]